LLPGGRARGRRRGIRKPIRFDGNDAQFYGGLALLGIGLSFAISWAVALSVVGAALALSAAATAFFEAGR
jgi:hypothetical protein